MKNKMLSFVLTLTLFLCMIASGAAFADDTIVCNNGILKEMPSRLHQKLFNASVNVGTNRGIKLLQQSLRSFDRGSVVVDGRMGPITRNAMCGLSEQALIDRYCKEQLNFYEGIIKRKPSQAKYRRGWTNRAMWQPEK